jgi:hypothetical protein
VLVGSWKARDRLENLGKDGSIILKCVLNRMGSYKLDLSGGIYYRLKAQHIIINKSDNIMQLTSRQHVSSLKQQSSGLNMLPRS